MLVDLASDEMFFTCGPPLGCLGVDVDDLVDVDESFLYFVEMEEKYGYALVGHKAEVVGSSIPGQKWTVMTATARRGVISHWIHRENTTSQVCVAGVCVCVCLCVGLWVWCCWVCDCAVWCADVSRVSGELCVSQANTAELHHER